jgi:hypothetical protein
MAKERVTCALPKKVYERVRELAIQRECTIGAAVGYLLDHPGGGGSEDAALAVRVRKLEEAVRRIVLSMRANGGGHE